MFNQIVIGNNVLRVQANISISLRTNVTAVQTTSGARSAPTVPRLASQVLVPTHVHPLNYVYAYTWARMKFRVGTGLYPSLPFIH